MDKNYENMGPMDSTAVQMVSAVGGYGTPAEMYDAVVQAYIAQNQHMNIHYLVEHAYQIAGDLMREITVNIDAHNNADKKHKWTMPTFLPATCAARLILATGDVVIIRLTSNKACRYLAMRGYDENGNITGIWLMDFATDGECSTLGGLVRAIMSVEASDSKVQSCRKYIMDELARKGMIYEEGWSKDLIIFFNGVYDGVKREFTYFTDKDYEAKYGSYHFLAKLDTDWNPNAKEKSYFKVLDFIRSVMPDDDLGDVQAKMILHAMQFTLRRYSGDEGNVVELSNALERAAGKNGKTTLTEMLMTAIDHSWGKAYDARTDKKNVGDNNGPKVVTVPVTDWEKDFMLTEAIGGTYAIISDDAADVPISDGAFKNIARGQSMQINRKGKDPVTYMMHLVGWLLQNGRLKMKDKKDSMFTHQMVFDMNRIFRPDEIDKKIKAQYIAEEETLEFLVHYLATEVEWLDDYPEELSAQMKGAVADMKNANIPTFRALDDIMYGLRMCPRIQCDFVFELYHGWCEQNGVDYNLTSADFWKDVVQWVNDHSDNYEIQNVKQDRIKVKKEYMIRDELYKVNADGTPVLVAASEWDILFNRLHPSVIQYGHPTKRWGAPRLVKTRRSFRGDDYVFGNFDSHAVTGKKLSRFIVNKHPAIGYDELFEDDDKQREMKDRYSAIATQNENEAEEVETNHPNEAAAIVALRQVSC